MKVTYNWLKEYTDFEFCAEELVHHLTMLGLEVEEAQAQTYPFSGVVVGEVLQKNTHPNADRLSVCTVNDGVAERTVVCGAPNVESGQKIALAQVGASLPGDLKIKKTKIRGVESLGMICSEAELGLSARADGIMVLDESAVVGAGLESVLEQEDFLVDIDVTPNRPDCFGALGVAREVASLSGTRLRKPGIDLAENGPATDDAIRVTIHDARKCPRYTARFIDNIRIVPSPFWLARRLEQVGIRSINNVVDVTNFVMMETGQPLHAFDYNFLAGGQISVKSADAGMEFTTLDGNSHKLTDEALLICDGEKPVALAGVMGGLNSEVSGSTTKVLLESAYFDPVNIRRTSKKLGISTESSKRFERGVDPNGVVYALDRAAQLIAELAGGRIAAGVADVYPKRIEPLSISLRPERVKLLLGVEVPPEQIESILTGLGFGVARDRGITVAVPTFRPDITREVDLIEEIGRVFGYDNIPSDPLAMIDQMATVDEGEAFTKEVCSTLVSFGFSEVVTYNLTSEDAASVFSEAADPVKLVNPLSEDLSTLRPSLIPGLLNCVRWNINRKSNDLKLFEIGVAFAGGNATPGEHKRLTCVLTGRSVPDSWQAKARVLNIFDAKGFTEHLLAQLGITAVEFVSTTLSTAAVAMQASAGTQILGYLGQVHSEVLAKLKVEQDVYFIDLDFEATELASKQKRTFKAIPKFPSVLRDLALLVDNDVSAADLVGTVKAAGGDLLQEVSVFDVYTGDKVESGSKSIALGLMFQSSARTLRESEIDSQIELILTAISQQNGARLRA